jgi:histidine triad (HIT) family protein
VSCLFCSIAAGEERAAIVLEDAECVGFLDHRPLFPGHTLVVPRTHVPALLDARPALVGALFASAQRLARAFGEALGAEGTFVALNDRVSQSVPHLHVHAVPRKKGDGLKGFFWPRAKYASDVEMEAVAARIRAALR